MWHVIGSTGFIGRSLIKRIPPEVSYRCYARHSKAGEQQIDLLNFSSDSCSEIQAGDYVVLLAAVSSPDICQNQYEMAYAINVVGTKQLITECLHRDARVLFFSSDVVVGATDRPHDETMPVSPLGAYGKMKREIELEFADDPRVKVFRLSYVFSREDKFMKYLYQCAEAGEKADVFQALYRNVVYLGDVLDAVIALGKDFDIWENSIFHLSGPKLLCRADMAECFRRTIVPNLQYTTRVPDQSFFEARPNVIETRSLYLDHLLRRTPLALAEALRLEYN